MSEIPFRVLCLDGGGIRGVFTASFLAGLEQFTGKKLIEYFDLIAGTSTGGLIALGLGLGHPPDKILDFYLKSGEKIFPNGRWHRWRHLWRAKYDSFHLQTAVQELLGSDTLLGKSKTRLVIPSFDATAGRPTCFKTRHHPSLKRDHKLTAWEVAMATAAAPTFFPAFSASWEASYVDGGVWANCPVLVGLLECYRFLDQPIENIQILNVGTTGEPFHIPEKLRLCRSGGKFPYVVNQDIIKLFMEASAFSSLFQAQLLLGERLTIINHSTASKRFGLDDCSSLRDLQGLGVERAKSECEKVGSLFLSAKAEPFRPIPD